MPCLTGQLYDCVYLLIPGDLEKHKQFTQSKFDIFSYTRLFLALTKEIAGKIQKFTQIWKKITQTWFAGLRVFPALGELSVKEW
jgi:hypothetical protein